jgi:hypothetical protein
LFVSLPRLSVCSSGSACEYWPASTEQNFSRHLGHWLGLFLRGDFPELMECGPVAQGPAVPIPLYSAMLEVQEEGLTQLEFTPTTLHQVTTKALYSTRVEQWMSSLHPRSSSPLWTSRTL